ncbi:hypothetical protein KAR91_68695 [Candidatus Pacearchaeota archaeon]|nr:hypothetical protein [Candidatus Pacearchaeota archaeon]
MGEILDLARQNAREILNDGFAIELIITPIGGAPVVINGITSVHSQGFDSDGLPIIGPNSHCTFSELDLTDKGVIARDAKGDLKMRDWKVSFDDQIGTYNCKFGELMPDRGLGLIVVKLNQIQP